MTLFLLVRHTPSWKDHGYRPATTAAAANGNGNGNGSDAGAGAARQLRSEARRKRWGQDWVMVETYAHRPWSYAERAVASVFVLGVAAAVAWSRIYLGYHTSKQVLVGTLAGALSALAWYGVTHVVRQTGLLHWALESPPARGLRLRDLVVTEDLSQAGWEKWEDRKVTTAQATSRKKK